MRVIKRFQRTAKRYVAPESRNDRHERQILRFVGRTSGFGRTLQPLQLRRQLIEERQIAFHFFHVVVRATTQILDLIQRLANEFEVSVARCRYCSHERLTLVGLCRDFFELGRFNDLSVEPRVLGGAAIGNGHQLTVIRDGDAELGTVFFINFALINLDVSLA